VALKFCVGYEGAASTLVGIATCGQVDENLEALELVVPGELEARIEGILGGVRGRVWVSGRVENN
jgi:aryl-alcohol dehydrogenase-like predicted oxidoreductase